MISKKTFLVSSLIALAVAFALGRYTTPVKTVTKVQTVEVEKKNEKSEAKKEAHTHTVTTITETKDNSGNDKRVTVIDQQSGETSDNRVDTKVDESVQQSTTKETSREAPVTVLALAGAQLGFTATPVLYGVSVSKPVLGPIAIGVWGLSNKTAGAALGLTF